MLLLHPLDLLLQLLLSLSLSLSLSGARFGRWRQGTAARTLCSSTLILDPHAVLILRRYVRPGRHLQVPLVLCEKRVRVGLTAAQDIRELDYGSLVKQGLPEIVEELLQLFSEPLLSPGLFALRTENLDGAVFQ